MRKIRSLVSAIARSPRRREARDASARSVQRVVLAQALHVARLEPRSLRRPDHRLKCGELAVGKHVLMDERVPPPEPVLQPRQAAACGRASSRLTMPWFSSSPPGSERAVQRREVAVEVSRAHVLHHPDARDPVELRRQGRAR